jgi:acetyltransferase-like isoleucine patch superfamily enzyme
MLRVIWYQLRWVLPLWLVGLVTNWWPTNRCTVRIRGLLAKPFIGSCGRKLQLGSGVQILSPHNFVVGNDVYIATGCWLNCLGEITLEDEVVLGPFVVISSLRHKFKDGSVRFGGSSSSPVRVGRGSWLAAHVCVKSGVSVGKGNIVGANSFVVKDTPDHVVVGGVPGKVICENTDSPGAVVSRSEFMNRSANGFD